MREMGKGGTSVYNFVLTKLTVKWIYVILKIKEMPDSVGRLHISCISRRGFNEVHPKS